MQSEHNKNKTDDYIYPIMIHKGKKKKEITICVNYIFGLLRFEFGFCYLNLKATASGILEINLVSISGS